MSTPLTRSAPGRASTVAFVVAVAATLVGLVATAAWVGFAPLAIVPAIAAYSFGRRAGVLAPTTSARRATRVVLLAVIAIVVALSIVMWGGVRG